MTAALKAAIVAAVESAVHATVAAHDLCIQHHGEWQGEVGIGRIAEEIARNAAQGIVLALEEP